MKPYVLPQERLSFRSLVLWGIALSILVLLVNALFAPGAHAADGDVTTGAAESPVTNLALWSLVVGFLTPIVLSLVQQPRWSDPVRSVVTFVFCAVVAIPTAYFAGDLVGKDYVTAGLLIFTSAITGYKGVWKPTGVAPKLEFATSPGASSATRAAADSQPPYGN